MKDHEIAQFVNELTKAAKTYGQTQQLRARIAEIVKRNLSEKNEEWVEVIRSPLVEDWLVIDETGACIEDGFTSKQSAIEWVEQRGYKLNE